MTVWSWLRLTACLWLVRKALKATGWLTAFATVIAAWPLTPVTVAGYVAAWGGRLSCGGWIAGRRCA